MHPRVQGELACKGLVTRRFAVKAGMEGAEIDRLVRRGVLVKVWRGVYTTSELWDALDEYVGRPRLRHRAACAHLYCPHVLSHDTAALELGLSVLDAPAQLVHVTRFGVVGTRHRHGVKHHKAPYEPSQLVLLDDERVALDPARTVADISRDRGLEAGLVAADSAMSGGLSRDALWAAVEPMTNWPYVHVVRRVIALADPGGETPGETLTRLMLIEMGHAPTTQFGLTDGRRTVWCDLRVGRRIIEFDGRAKYSIDGVADDQRLWDEKERQDFITGFRLDVSRLVWADLFGERRRETMRRLDRQIQQSHRVLGSDVGDLESFIVRGPRPRRSR